jgi:SAM-dependent methyltransferase
VKVCPLCGHGLSQDLEPWLFRCHACGFQRSSLAEQIAGSAAHEAIDERARADALGSLRQRNTRAILEALGRLRAQRGRLLDVGCAHGWFLAAATADGWRAVGIEPDRGMAEIARAAGNQVRSGAFPAALVDGETFEAITFNDVFEHLPDVDEALRSCKRALVPGGLLAINLPDARGPFHRLARVLARVGVRSPLERLWQKGFPSPHLSYFTASLLRRLARKHGFSSLYGSRLASVELRGLWARLRYDRTAGIVRSAAAYAGTCALLPAVRILPSDISLEIFQREP